MLANNVFHKNKLSFNHQYLEFYEGIWNQFDYIVFLDFKTACKSLFLIFNYIRTIRSLYLRYILTGWGIDIYAYIQTKNIKHTFLTG